MDDRWNKDNKLACLTLQARSTMEFQRVHYRVHIKHPSTTPLFDDFDNAVAETAGLAGVAL